MAIDFNDYKCQFCGKPAKGFAFAAFVCEEEECLNKAFEERGGPGGHMKRKAAGKPIIPEDPDEL